MFYVVKQHDTGCGFSQRPAERPAIQYDLEVRVFYRDSKLAEMADFRRFHAVNKSRNCISLGTERPAKIRSCIVPTRPDKSLAIPVGAIFALLEVSEKGCEALVMGYSRDFTPLGARRLKANLPKFVLPNGSILGSDIALIA